ncbi:ParA family protein [Solicola sp. PLA-1-18]|uniref:ParA family protein n=1 Tax=Solicola sp. PLA-1-18 TaxID=3380532 RepID=UPI003B774BA2
MTPQDTEALSRVICFANGKGGAGKTSTAVNFAGLCASAGHRTLLLDLDPQANAGHDLGYGWTDQSDDGNHIASTLMSPDARLTPTISAVRDNLDVISGGAALNDLEDVVAGRSRRGLDSDTILATALAPLAAGYDLVVIDTPPTRPVLLRMALTASRWIVVPTRADRSSIEGLRVLAEQIITIRPANPHVAILGAVLFDVSTTATAIRRNAAQDIADVLGGVAPVFGSVIRHSELVATQARENGQLVHEIAETVEDAEPFWVALKEGRAPRRVPGSAPALADDYVLLTQEILAQIAELEAQQGVPA